MKNKKDKNFKQVFEGHPKNYGHKKLVQRKKMCRKKKLESFSFFFFSPKKMGIWEIPVGVTGA